MQYRGFKARWYLECFNIITKKWQLSSVFVDGLWEEAVTECAKRYEGSTIKSRKFRVSPVAILLEE